MRWVPINRRIAITSANAHAVVETLAVVQWIVRIGSRSLALTEAQCERHRRTFTQPLFDAVTEVRRGPLGTEPGVSFALEWIEERIEDGMWEDFQAAGEHLIGVLLSPDQAACFVQTAWHPCRLFSTAARRAFVLDSLPSAHARAALLRHWSVPVTPACSGAPPADRRPVRYRLRRRILLVSNDFRNWSAEG